MPCLPPKKMVRRLAQEKPILVNVPRENIPRSQAREQQESAPLSEDRNIAPFIFSGPTRIPGYRVWGGGRSTGPNSYIYINNQDVCPTLGFPILYRIVERCFPRFPLRVEVCSRIQQCVDYSLMPIGSLRKKSVETMKRPPSPHPTQSHVYQQKRPHGETWRISTGGLRAS